MFAARWSRNGFIFMPEKQHLEELAQFIRAHRSSEGHFQALYDRLAAELKAIHSAEENDYTTALAEAAEKHAAAYRQSKDTGSTTWPEFENFVTHFEKAVMQALH